MKVGDKVYFPLPCPEGYPEDKWVGEKHGWLFWRLNNGEWIVQMDGPPLMVGATPEEQLRYVSSRFTTFVRASEWQFEVVS